MKKGYTLVEFLAVIMILVILVLIVYPVVTNLIDTIRKSSYEKQVNNLVLTGKEWLLYNSSKLSKEEINCISLEQLQREKYIKPGDIVNPRTGNNMEGYLIYTFDSNYNQFTIRYNEVCE